MAGIGLLRGGPGAQAMPSGFNIAELPGNHSPFTSAFGLTGVPQEKNGAYPESNPYLKFFGMPVRNGQEVGPSPQNRDHFDWAEAYDRASVPTMTEYTITQLRESDMVLCRAVLPFVITEDKIDIKWNEWHFNDAMLDPRPAETASRLLSCNFTQGSDTMQTMGRAMEMEDGFYKTTAGQMHFIMQWKQIVNATAMTLEFGAATALANVRQPGNAQIEQLRSGVSSEQLRAIALREVNLFNCITRGGGLDIAIEHTERILASRGITTQIDTVIVPDGTAKHINDPTFRPFFMTGVPVPEHPSTEVRYKNKRIISSRLHSVGGEGPPQDPHFRWVTTGSFYVSDHNITYDMPIDEYQSTHRTEQVWDEDEDDYRFITLEEMVVNSGLFQADPITGVWVLSNKIGVPFFAGLAVIGDFYDVQGKTVRLKADNYKSDEIRAEAERAYAIAQDKCNPKPGGIDLYAGRAAFLTPVHTPGDAFLNMLQPTTTNEPFFDTSRELIDAILDMPIKHIGMWFQWCIGAHVPIPLSFVLANPYQRWYAGTLQTMRAGTDLGGTFIGHFDVQAGRDYVRKMLGLHVTAMMKSIVVNPKLIANAPNVLVKGYDGGGGTRPWVPTNAEHISRFSRGNSQLNDQFTFAVTRLRPNWALDINGRFNPQIVTGPENRDPATEIKTAKDAAEAESAAIATKASDRRISYLHARAQRQSHICPMDAVTGVPDLANRPPVATYPRRIRLEPDSKILVYHNLLRQRYHYTSAEIYRGVWKFEHFEPVAPSTIATTARPKTNTICMPGHQFSVSPTTSKHSLVRISKDHRGPWVYPGCGKVRTGLEISLRPPAYIGADIATAVSSMSVIG